MHNSGLLLGCNSESRAVLTAVNKAKQHHLIPRSDGSVVIALGEGSSATFLSLGTANGWSTYYVKDSADARAHYFIEPASGVYVKLKNAQTNGYLGTDDVTEGSYAYSNKSGSEAKHLWILSETPTVEIKPDTISYAVLADGHRQLNEGWGVSLCWWAGQCGKWSDKKIDEIVDWLVSPKGLNWNIFRYNIGGGDDPNWTNCTEHHMGSGKGLRAEMEGFQDERGGVFHWERDAAQRKIMLKIKEKRPDAIFEAFSNSAPWWMTVSGCVAGNADGGKDNLKPEYYTDFANYLVEVCKHYKEEYGIEFKTLEPFNECTTSYWHQSGAQEGCHFDNSSQIAFIKVLEPILLESGLSTVISASDETNVGGSLGTLNAYIKDGIISKVPQWNTHTYGASIRERSQIGSLVRSMGHTMWMSETGSGGSGIAGNLNMAQRLFDDVRYIAPSAWIDWQYMEEANDQWCFIRGNFANATYNKVKNYYVRQQVTRFMPAGYTFVTSLNEQSLAALNPTCDTLAISVLNTSGNEALHRISLPMVTINGAIKAYRTSEKENLATITTKVKVEADSLITIPLPSASIATVLIPIELQTEAQPQLVDGDTYMIIPQSNARMAVGTSATDVKLMEANINDPTQQWTVIAEANGTYKFRNAKGQYANYPGSYGLTAVTTAKSTGQSFLVESVDGIFSRIMQKGSTKGWDLEGNNLNAGTKIGLWEYGTSPTADTRNWHLVRIATQQSDVDGIASKSTTSATTPTAIYNLRGQRIPTLQPGINIMRSHDGKYRKVFK